MVILTRIIHFEIYIPQWTVYSICPHTIMSIEMGMGIMTVLFMKKPSQMVATLILQLLILWKQKKRIISTWPNTSASIPVDSGIMSNLLKSGNWLGTDWLHEKTRFTKSNVAENKQSHQPKSLHHFLSHANFYFEDFLSFEKFYGCFFFLPVEFIGCWFTFLFCS